MTTSGSQLTRDPSNLRYAQLDQRAKVNYLHWRTQALQAKQAAVALDALTEPFSVDVYLGLKPKPQPSARSSGKGKGAIKRMQAISKRTITAPCAEIYSGRNPTGTG